MFFLKSICAILNTYEGHTLETRGQGSITKDKSCQQLQERLATIFCHYHFVVKL